MTRFGGVAYAQTTCPICGTPCHVLDGGHYRPWLEDDNAKLRGQLEERRVATRTMFQLVAQVKAKLRHSERHRKAYRWLLAEARWWAAKEKDCSHHEPDFLFPWETQDEKRASE